MQSLTGRALAAAFDAGDPYTVGLEEEVMLLDPDTLELTDRAAEIVERAATGALKLELPASQVEIATPPRCDVATAIADLAAGRRCLLEACAGLARPAVAGVHPFSPVEGRLSDGPRYEATAVEYGTLARRQLVCALQVHVAVGRADTTLAVYNALRGYLPDLAALAANAPAYGGQVTDLASVRPKLSELLPRQGVPPALASWDALAEELRWGAAAGAVPDAGTWWWELRLHPRWGTIELRVPDAQTTIADAAAVAGVCHALVIELAESREVARDVPGWRIDANRWSACRYGVAGTMADLVSGERRPTRERLHALLDRLEAIADMTEARALVERNGAMRQRDVAAERGLHGLAAWLADRFEE